MSKYNMDSIDRFVKKIKEFYNIRLPAYYNNSKDNIDRSYNSNTDDEGTQDTPGITVITSTIRPEFIENVFENYNRQTYEKKEFIIVLNKNSMDIKKWKMKAKEYKNVRVFQVDERFSFGQCYNFCVSKSKYDYIAPFDDDDYYAPNYLNDIVEAFQISKAYVVGKKCRYLYFEKSGILALGNKGQENCYVDHIDGPTLSFNKKIFDRVKFTDKPIGIDGQFCKDCIANNIKIYSTNRFNHAYIRHSSSHQHTWVIDDDTVLSWCDVIGKVENYQEYVAK